MSTNQLKLSLRGQWKHDQRVDWDACGTTRAEERQASAGLHDYTTYLDGELERHFRGYAFWVEERRIQGPTEPLPAL